ncbi:MAG: hypothetical protein LUD25_03520, partial [Coriobacteriaceae bacterium]|nr:hypothetical protein [Coriobacteriaceae bacterium]
ENRQDESAGRVVVPDTEDEETTPAQSISRALKQYWWVLVIIIAAVIVFLILLRRALRRRWLAAIDRLPRTEGVYNLYRFFLFGIGKSGCRRTSNQTLEEFWESREAQLRKFDTEGVDFGKLTATYRKVYFGRQTVSEDEYADYLTYYKGFHKHVRREAGFWRYLILYFRL